MKKDLSTTIEEIGRRGELEQDKLFCLLLNMQEKLRQESAEDPTYQKSQDIERLDSVIESYREYIWQGRNLFDQLTGWLQRMKQVHAMKSKEDSENVYPLDTLYHMAVAEQEKDLHRLYPGRFGGE